MLEHRARELDAEGGVRLWLVDVEDDATHDERLSLLSPDERERAASYPGALRGRRFARTRAALRILLGELAGVAPTELQFAYGRDGKPSLVGAHATRQLQFNVSHARDLALIAVAPGLRVGVDIAWMHGETRLAPIVERFFSLPERSAFEAAAEDERREVFTRIWVRKEAYLKARGEGISERIYETDFGPRAATGGDLELRLGSEGAIRDQDQWLVRDVDGLPEGFMASVALERRTT